MPAMIDLRSNGHGPILFALFRGHGPPSRLVSRAWPAPTAQPLGDSGGLVLGCLTKRWPRSLSASSNTPEATLAVLAYW